MGKTVGVILAGGQASRMNYLDKPLLSLAGKPIIKHVIDSALPQVNEIVLSVNRSIDSYHQFRLPLVMDHVSNCKGPLVGIFSAMKWYSEQETNAEYLACFPADVPVFPNNIVSKLTDAMQGRRLRKRKDKKPDNLIAWCRTGQQIQPLFSLWHFSLLESLERAMRHGIHGPRLFFPEHPNVSLNLPTAEEPQFFNINTLADLELAESMFMSWERPN